MQGRFLSAGRSNPEMSQVLVEYQGEDCECSGWWRKSPKIKRLNNLIPTSCAIFSTFQVVFLHVLQLGYFSNVPKIIQNHRGTENRWRKIIHCAIYSLIFLGGVKSNLAEKIRVNKRVCAIYPGIPGACKRARIRTSWASSAKRAGWVWPEISTRCNCQRKHLHWLENPPWWSMIPHWKSNDFLTSSGMKATKKTWEHFTEKEYPHLFHFFYQPWNNLKCFWKDLILGSSCKIHWNQILLVTAQSLSTSQMPPTGAPPKMPSATGFFMATCHRSRSSTARRLAVVKQPAVDTSTATVANDGDQCRKSAEVSICHSLQTSPNMLLGPFQQVKCRRLARLPPLHQPLAFWWPPASEADLLDGTDL